MQPVSPDRAKDLIQRGHAPDGLQVRGHLDLSGQPIEALPAGLTVEVLTLTGCAKLRALPPGLQVRRLHLNGCTSLAELPVGLRCYELEMQDTPVTHLPADLRV